MKCKIQWVDSSGQPTPDENDAVAMVFREAYIEQHGDHVHEMERSDDYPICQKHLDVLTELQRVKPEAHHWLVNPLPPETYPAAFVDTLIETGLEMAERLDESNAMLHYVRRLVEVIARHLSNLESTGLDEILLACAGRSLDNPEDRHYLKSKLVAAINCKVGEIK